MEIFKLDTTLLKMTTDLRAEVVARELIESKQTDVNNVLIVPEGAFKRSSSKDVCSLTADSDDDKAILKIHATREGISDMLPPGIIHQPTINRQERSTEVMLEDIDIYESEFSNARTFFLPFDIEFGKKRIFLETLEHNSVTDMYSYYGDDLFDYLWYDLKLELNSNQKTELLKLTIQAHKIIGDLKHCEKAMSRLLNQNVIIEKGCFPLEMPNEFNIQNLGESLLGVNWVLLEDYVACECLNIVIGPVADNELMNFRNHQDMGKGFRLLEFLCDLLLPVEVPWKMTLIAQAGHFRISKTQETATLGYTTVLE